MGKTFKKNTRWKKDRRDTHFRESKKFKNFQHDYQHRHKTTTGKPVTEDPVVEEDLAEDQDNL